MVAFPLDLPPKPAASLHVRDWEEMARLDPLWAILSDPKKRFGNWDLQDFLRTGDQEIAGLMATAKRLGLPHQFRHAIDFGCGVGRLTRALHAYFTDCHGVDISSRMLEMAVRLAPECDFRQGDDLSSFPAGYADLVYSSLVLQHQPDRAHVVALIQDMLRALAPGGLLAFQMVIHLPWRNRLQLRRRIYRALRALGIRDSLVYGKLKLSPIRMVSLPRPQLEEIVCGAGGQIVHEHRETAPYPSSTFYCTVKS